VFDESFRDRPATDKATSAVLDERVELIALPFFPGWIRPRFEGARFFVELVPDVIEDLPAPSLEAFRLHLFRVAIPFHIVMTDPRSQLGVILQLSLQFL